jgi:hypothetical protein
MTNNKILIEDLHKLKLLMIYDNSKTHSENLFLEQTAYEMFLDRTFEDPEKAQKYLDSQAALAKAVYQFFAGLDTHDWLALVEISTGLLGLIPTPLSPLLLGISVAAGVTDAGLYYKEGDPYMGTMMLVLSIIPGGELISLLKGSKVLSKRGVKGCQQLIKKAKSGAKLTSEEADDLIKLGRDISKNSVEITKVLKRTTTKNIIESLSQKTPKYMMNLLLILKRLGVIKLGEIVLKVGGVSYTFDKLYLYIFRDSIFADKESLDQRTRNDLRATVNKLLGYDKEVKEYLLIKTTDALEKIATNPNVDPVTINPTESVDEWAAKEFKNNFKAEKEKERQEYLKSLIAPSINEVLMGQKTIKLNQKGPSVKEIQKMLYEIGYDYLVNNFNELEKWDDGIYGEGTKYAIETFQEDNGLKVDGIVGSNTLKKLKEIYKNKIEGNNETE